MKETHNNRFLSKWPNTIFKMAKTGRQECNKTVAMYVADSLQAKLLQGTLFIFLVFLLPFYLVLLLTLGAWLPSLTKGRIIGF